MIALEKYGGGASPALEQTVSESIQTGFVEADLRMHPEEKEILRILAERVATLAALPVMKDKRELWRRHNRLEATRPVIFCDPENGWNEIITDRQLLCKTKIARRWEMNLRKEIFWGEEMGDDRPVEAIFNVPYTCSADDWGAEIKFHKAEQLGSFVWDSPIKDYAKDLPRIHPLDLRDRLEGFARHASIWPRRSSAAFSPSARKAPGGGRWASPIPRFCCAACRTCLPISAITPTRSGSCSPSFCEGHMKKLDYLEANNLLSLNNDGTYVGSGGYGYTDELPPSGFQRQCPLQRHVGIYRKPGIGRRVAEDV